MTVVATGEFADWEFRHVYLMPVLPLTLYTVSLSIVPPDFYFYAELMCRMDLPPSTAWGAYDTYATTEGDYMQSSIYSSPSHSFLYVALSGSFFPWELSVDPFVDEPTNILTSYERSTIGFHLKQCSIAFSPSDLLTTNDLPGIRSQLASVEAAYLLTGLTAGTLLIEKLDETNQDIVTTTDRDGVITTTTYGDRLVTKSARPSYQQRLTAYHKEVEKLAIALGINV